MSKPITLYAIIGLGADHRVFQYLELHAKIVHLHWLEPRKKESLVNYAHRLAEKIDTSSPFALIGVSFGGLIATEIAKKYPPKFTFLISSTDVKNGLHQLYGWVGKMKFLNWLPPRGFDIPKGLVPLLFVAKNKKLLRDILNESDLKFTKWAVMALTQWENKESLSNVLKINGSKDLLIPGNKDSNTIMVENGTHFMVVDQASEISKIINDYLKNTILQ